MKKLLLYAAILAAALAVPLDRVDAGELRPVEVVAIYKKENRVMIATDTGDAGLGKDVAEALENMRDTSPAVIYLDTAEYLLVQFGEEEAVEKLRDVLKPSVRICNMKGQVDLKLAAEYLPVHGNLPKLRKWTRQAELPVLKTEYGRLCFA